MKYVKLTIGLIIISLIVSLSVTISKYNTLSEDYSIAVGNEKALLQNNSKLNEDIGVLQLSVDQLSYFNDSLLVKLDSVRRELKIKDKELKYMQYNKTTFEKTDSIVFLKDTIFRDKLHIDTTLHNKWYSLNLTLDYPNSVTVTPKIISEQYLIIRADKETVKPPKKCKLARWFQKKHTVIRAELKEENPYIEHQCSRFVKILDK
ncbi:MAG: hypothetical protein U0K68_01775 [Agathobacter sp.]|jgi:hypothetical protein|nr:hypothetical protein [Agathobacter sp.]